MSEEQQGSTIDLDQLLVQLDQLTKELNGEGDTEGLRAKVQRLENELTTAMSANESLTKQIKGDEGDEEGLEAKVVRLETELATLAEELDGKDETDDEEAVEGLRAKATRLEQEVEGLDDQVKALSEELVGNNGQPGARHKAGQYDVIAPKLTRLHAGLAALTTKVKEVKESAEDDQDEDDEE